MKDNIINIRISDNLRIELDFISQELEEPLSSIARVALQQFVENYETQAIHKNTEPKFPLISSESFAKLLLWFSWYTSIEDCLDLNSLQSEVIIKLKKAELELGSKDEFLRELDRLSSKMYQFIDLLHRSIKIQSLSNYQDNALSGEEFDNLLTQLAICTEVLQVVYLKPI